MTYTLTCPDEDCGHVFKHDAKPEDLAEGGDLITCPECGEEWAWELAEDGTLTLLSDEFEDDGLENELEEDDEEEDDEEEDDPA